MNPTGAGIVVVKREEGTYKFLILLQDIAFQNWSFPKGKLEEGESLIEGALRELEEETAITDIQILDFPLIIEEYEFIRGGKDTKVSNRYFVGIVEDPLIQIQKEEIYEYKWATFEEALATFGFKKEHRAHVLEQAKKYLDHYEHAQ